MDVLSEVLRVIRLSGAVHFCAEYTQPFAVGTPPPSVRSRLAPDAAAVVHFHIATRGACWLILGSVPPILLEAGDLIMFANRAQHSLMSEPGLTPVSIRDIYQPSAGTISNIQYGGGGAAFHIVCGYLQSDQRFAPLLDAMPALIRVRSRNNVLRLETFTESGQYADPVLLDQDVKWWCSTIDHLVSETAEPGAGSHALLARLSELLFMEIVRWQLIHVSVGHSGWLAGLNDPHVGRALSLLHAEPARAWTVEELANEAGISRAALARRFVELVGESPMQYLAAWRMHLARRELRDGKLALGEISARVGYDSEAAFSRAFRRLVGLPPASWREANTISIVPPL
jgi:AraC family transcriptional regulator, alkane utilization regulator